MTIDSNIIILYLGGDAVVQDAIINWRRGGRPLFLSTVVETEVLSFRGWSGDERRATEQFLEENFTSIPFDRSIARIAAAVRRDTAIKFPDAAIAATALFTRTPLVTRNFRDFRNIAELSLYPL